MQLILLMIRSGMSFSALQKTTNALLKIHTDNGPVGEELNSDLWSINRTISRLPRKRRIRIDEHRLVGLVSYAADAIVIQPR